MDWPFPDGIVNFGLNSQRFRQCCDDALVVGQVIVGKLPPFAVFQPFVATLIAADMEMPYFRRHALEILGAVNPDAPGSV